jgi:hypothetical protein
VNICIYMKYYDMYVYSCDSEIQPRVLYICMYMHIHIYCFPASFAAILVAEHTYI